MISLFRVDGYVRVQLEKCSTSSGGLEYELVHEDGSNLNLCGDMHGLTWIDSVTQEPKQLHAPIRPVHD
jgi:acyl-CoA thioesterase FadM